MTTIAEAVKACCTITQAGQGKSTTYKVAFGYFEARATTQGEALTRLLKKVEQAIEGEYRPLMIAFRSEYVIIYRTPTEDWAYIGPMEPGKEHKHASTNGLPTRDEAERQARLALAQKVWDRYETTSTIITNEQDQEAFRAIALHMIENPLPKDPRQIDEQTFWEHWNAASACCEKGSGAEIAMMRAFYLREYSRCQPNGVAATMLEDALLLQENNQVLASAYRTYVSDLYGWAGIEEEYRHIPDAKRRAN